MDIDVSRLHLLNVSDTCSVWNVLSSTTLYRCALLAKVHFICPTFVVYECLYKPRSAISTADTELRRRLVCARNQGRFQSCELSIDDLQTIHMLEQRKHLGKGELAALAVAQKIGQACLTDDQKARRLGHEFLGRDRVQTTPHLLGWLVFEMKIGDTDIETVVTEHREMDGPLAKYFREVHVEGCRCRLMANQREPAL